MAFSHSGYGMGNYLCIAHGLFNLKARLQGVVSFRKEIYYERFDQPHHLMFVYWIMEMTCEHSSAVLTNRRSFPLSSVDPDFPG